MQKKYHNPAKKKEKKTGTKHKVYLLKKNYCEELRFFSDIYLKQTFVMRKIVPETARINRKMQNVIPHSFSTKTFPAKNG